MMAESGQDQELEEAHQHVVGDGDGEEEGGYKDEDILQQFQTEDGGTIVLSSEQIAQMQQVRI